MAKSELNAVSPRNWFDGGVFDTRRIFHVASAAREVIRPVAVSRDPARSPTRGSGRGGVVDMLGAGDGPALTDDVDDEHALAVTNTAAIETNSAELGRAASGGNNESRFTLEFSD